MAATADNTPSLTVSRLFRIAWFLLSPFPTRRVGPTRARLLRLVGADIGEGVTFGPGVRLIAPHRLVIGSRTRIARDATIDARAGVEIGPNTMIGFEAVVLSETHRFEDPDQPVRDQGMEGRPVRIGSNAWLGARVFVLPGRNVGNNAIVGASSVVTRDVDPNTIVAGNPAKLVRERDPGELTPAVDELPE
ncbi:MAG: acyltransferase [Actinobacteria bacterium]|nr:acyltransferase [Actinomycetota bacterium]